MGRTVFGYQEELNRDFTIIMPDLSGNGDTKGPEKQVTIQNYMNELKALLDHLHIKKALFADIQGGVDCTRFSFTLSGDVLRVNINRWIF